MQEEPTYIIGIENIYYYKILVILLLQDIRIQFFWNWIQSPNMSDIEIHLQEICINVEQLNIICWEDSLQSLEWTISWVP